MFCVPNDKKTWETNQNIIKYLAFIVVGNKKPNGTKTSSFAFGNK